MKSIVHLFTNLRPKLILSYALILIIPSLVIGTWSFITAKNTVEEKIKDGISENINLLNASISNAIDPKIENVAYLSEQMNKELYEEEKRPELERLIRIYGEIFPEEVLATYIVTDSGLFVQYPAAGRNKNYNAKKQEWFMKAKENPEEIIVSQPYISHLNNQMVVTISKATKDRSGVVAIDLSLAYLQKSLNKSRSVWAAMLSCWIKMETTFTIRPLKQEVKQNLPFMTTCTKQKAVNLNMFYMIMTALCAM